MLLTRTRSTIVTTTALFLAASMVLAASPAVAVAPVAVSSAKAKCVNVKTGFARYSPRGVCKKGERKDRKPCAKGG